MVTRFIRKLEGNESSWCILEFKKQYELLGYYHETTKLLYVQDYSKLKCAPEDGSIANFLWEDINLTKGSSFAIHRFTLGEDHPDKTVFLMHRAPCKGVKVTIKTYFFSKFFSNAIFFYYRCVKEKREVCACTHAGIGQTETNVQSIPIQD